MNTYLEIVNLSWNGFSDMGAAALGEMLASNTELTELDISSNRISLEGTEHLAKGIKKNTTLRCLKVEFILLLSVNKLTAPC